MAWRISIDILAVMGLLRRIAKHQDFFHSSLRKQGRFSLALDCGQLPLEIANTQHRLGENSANLFAWDSVCNYGDYLGPLLFQALTQKCIHVESRKLVPVIEAGQDRVIYCFLGTMAQLLTGNSTFIIFGMGVSGANENTEHGDRELSPGLDLDVRALRGKLSLIEFQRAGYSVSDDVPLGDPALLLPGLIDLKLQKKDAAFEKRSVDKHLRLGLIPHHNRVSEYREKYPEFRIIDPKTCNPHSFRKLIEKIRSLDAVITSSLHVAILCETIGTPVGVLEPKNTFKFDDFYSAIGKKTPYLAASSLKEGNTITLSWKSFDWDSEFYMSKFPLKIAPNFVEAVSNHYAKLSKLRSVDLTFDFKSEYFEGLESNYLHTINLCEQRIVQKLSEKDFTVDEDLEHGFRSYSYSDWIDASNYELFIIEFDGLNAGARIWVQSHEFETWETKDSEDGVPFHVTLLPQLLIDSFRIVIFSNENWRARITLYGN